MRRAASVIGILVISLMIVQVVHAQEAKPIAKEAVSFGTLGPMNADDARTQASAWLQSATNDTAALKAFDTIWAVKDRSVLDRVAETFALADADAAKTLAEARNPESSPPTAVPAAIKDVKKPAFYRANLGLAYAKALSQRRVYEEALEGLKAVKAEHVVDPGAYLFHRAVAEHALMQKEDATRTIVRLLDDTTDVPDRYKMVSILMAFDMQAWQEKDLGWIARKMDNIERRLNLSRGGPKTQKIQKDVVLRLDEMIKKIENECKGDCNGGQCPNGGQPGSNAGGAPNSPQKDSIGGKNSGPGNVDPKRLQGLAQQWGKLPEKERAKAMQDLTREMPPKYRDIIESYFKKLAASESNRP